MQRKGLFLIQTLGTTHSRSSKEIALQYLIMIASFSERYVWYGGDALFIKMNLGWNNEIVWWKGKCNE